LAGLRTYFSRRKTIKPSRVKISDGREKSLFAFHLVFWIAALFLGACHNWAVRHVMDEDGISYFDMADAYFRGDWKVAINSFWSPFYPWLLGLAMKILHPIRYWEFGIAHLVNFLTYVVSLACFSFFMTELIRYKKSKYRPGTVELPEWIWICFGYTLFIWSSLNLNDMLFATPDVCVTIFVYLAFGFLVCIWNGSRDWLTFILFGCVLGLGYLCRAYMFPLAFIFWACALISMRNLKKAIPRVLVSVFFFLMFAIPLSIAISKTQGRATFGDQFSTKYFTHVNNLDWYVNDGVSEFGVPLHPPQKVFDAPKIYQFATSYRETYPLHYRHAYWQQGLKPKFKLGEYLKFLGKMGVYYYYVAFVHHLGSIFVVFLILFLMSDYSYGQRFKNLFKQWPIFIPALCGLGIFFLIHPAWRYIFPFVTVMIMALFSSVRLRESLETKKLIVYSMLTVVGFMWIPISAYGGKRVVKTILDLTQGETPSSHVEWQVYDGLKRMGIQDGDPVASLGSSNSVYWPRLLRSQIISELPDDQIEFFWRSNPDRQALALKAFKSTGAKVLVAVNAPPNALQRGWKRIGETNHYVYFLQA